MFPQITGKLQIPSITFEGIVVQQNRNVDPFEAFFNGGSGYIEVKKKIVAPGIEIQVDPLPQRPANFSGGVGKFIISAQLDKTETKANDPVSMRVVISGTGNLKLLKQPVINVPKDFDKYEPKVTDKTKLTSSGIEGSMIYDVLIVPRHQGKFEIPPVEFTYFDTSENAYKTIKSDGFKLDVAKGSGAASVSDFSGQDLQELSKDIRYIKLGNTRQRSLDDFFFGSTAYWISLIVLALIFITLFIVFRQRAIDNANVTKMRGKKANKVATKRLKQAAKLMDEGKSSAFYDEVLRALWGYVGDKLNIPVEQLSHDNISQKLSERSVDADTIDHLIQKDDAPKEMLKDDERDNLSAVFQSQLPKLDKTEFIVEVNALGEEQRPVVITQNEWMRRMKEMSRYQSGMAFYGQLPDSFNLVLNSDHRLVKQVLNEAQTTLSEQLKPIEAELRGQEARLAALNQQTEKLKPEEVTQQMKDDKEATQHAIDEQKEKRQSLLSGFAAQNDVVHQLIDLALLQNGMLKGAALDAFLRRSVDMIK